MNGNKRSQFKNYEDQEAFNNKERLLIRFLFYLARSSA